MKIKSILIFLFVMLLIVTPVSKDGGSIQSVNYKALQGAQLGQDALQSTEEEDVSSHDEGDVLSGYDKVCETNDLMLYYNKTKVAVAVQDKSNDFIWTSAVNPNELKELPPGNALQKTMSSLFLLYYCDFSNGDNKISKTYSNRIQGLSVNMTQTGSGIKIDYYISEAKLGFTMEIAIAGNEMNVSIPFDKIKENGDFGITKIVPLPYFGAVGDDVPGYIFYPDGSGAIMNFDASRWDEIGRSQTILPVYGIPYAVDSLDETDIPPYNIRSNQAYTDTHLPVFGLKKGDNGFLGILTEGEYDSYLIVTPSNEIEKINRVCAEFVYRNNFELARSNMNIGQMQDYKDINLTKTNKKITTGDRSIKYHFLNGSNADYSGMANAYQGYLIGNHKLKGYIGTLDEMPLNLDILNGVKTQSIIFKKKIVMTTFKQTRQILESLTNAGVKGINATLLGWNSNGYKSYGYDNSPAGWLGGRADLKNLSDYSAENNINVGLALSLVSASHDSPGFNIKRDGVIRGNGLAAVELGKYLLNPAKSFARLSSLVSEAKKNRVTSVALEDIGLHIYRDYNKTNPSTRQQCAELWIEYASKAGSEGFLVTANGANAYLFSQADSITNVPMKASDLFIESSSVPFLQLVLHGYINYSSQPGNDFYDKKTQQLKWIEYGCNPYFILSASSNEKLINTPFADFFSTYSGDYIQYAVGTYNSLKDKLGDLWKQPMIKHELLENNIVKVSYKNGKTIYINYNKNAVEVDGHDILPLDFAVA